MTRKIRLPDDERRLPKDEPRLPWEWYFFAVLLVGAGAILLFFAPHSPPWLDKLSSRIRPGSWSSLLGTYLLSMGLTYFLASWTLLFIRKKLFALTDPITRKNLWPPAILGMIECIFYPTAFLMEHSEFIGFWVLLKTAGQWPRWGLSGKSDAELNEGRRRYYLFLIGNALTVLSGLATYAIIKIHVVWN